MKLSKIKCLNSLDLKMLAMMFMLCDHMWATVIPGSQWLTNIGRLAFPIFAFEIAEGYAHTHNFKKYLSRMFLFAIVSEIPFNLMYGGGAFFPFHQNVMFTYCIALLFLRFMDWGKSRNMWVYAITVALSVVLGYGLGFITMVDYFGFGVLMIILFYFFRNMKYGWIGVLIGMIYINGSMMAGLTLNFTLFGINISFPQQALAVLALIPIWMYNGKQGPKNKAVQIGCYAFYPVHMLILYTVLQFITR